MKEYDFLNLSAYEFEHFTRDVLQKHLNKYIESFTSGRDQGIDLRYSELKGSKIIIQAKRYTDFRSLVSSIKKELPKIKLLNPSKYILVTSVGLTPSNKNILASILGKYIHSSEDIFGKNDLNNLLRKYPEIELQYYKLWLPSTAVLNKILHSKVHNQSTFELEIIKDQIKLYVQNDSFNQAITILNENRYVIISGIPGIGKTTLGRSLVLNLLSEGFEQLVYLNRIDDGYELFVDGIKQIFFFDDFLGKNFLEERGTSYNEDSKIVKFIEKIRRTPDKLLIITTREYILKQAKKKFETFTINNIEIAKCILDLSYYTNLIKAKILYNHLFFAEIPVPYLEAIIEGKEYMRLIRHMNFNPRIIETIVEYKVWNNCQPKDFPQKLISFFDNPESVWKHAFENSIDEVSQYSLLILMSIGTPISIENWYDTIQEFFMINGISIKFDSIAFEKNIRELENTFIRLEKDSKNTIAVHYHNPSIQDFLVNYLRNKQDLINKILKASICVEQFFTIFGVIEIFGEDFRILLNKKSVDIAIERIMAIFDEIKSLRLSKYSYPNSKYDFTWHTDNEFIYSFLSNIYREFASHNKKANQFVYKKLQENIYIKVHSSTELESYINLLLEVDLSKLEYEEELFFRHIFTKINWVDDLHFLQTLESKFKNYFKFSYAQKTVKDIVRESVNNDMNNLEYRDISDLKEKIMDLEKTYKVSFDDELFELEKKESENSPDMDSGYTNLDLFNSHKSQFIDEQQQIDEIFETLL